VLLLESVLGVGWSGGQVRITWVGLG
jgi:hypothetical protein